MTARRFDVNGYFSPQATRASAPHHLTDHAEAIPQSECVRVTCPGDPFYPLTPRRPFLPPKHVGEPGEGRPDARAHAQALATMPRAQLPDTLPATCMH